jgi:hypothetical protein
MTARAARTDLDMYGSFVDELGVIAIICCSCGWSSGLRRVLDCREQCAVKAFNLRDTQVGIPPLGRKIWHQLRIPAPEVVRQRVLLVVQASQLD